MKECPYCNNCDRIDNSNLTHKFKHQRKGCEKYFKVCNICNTMYVNEDENTLSIEGTLHEGYIIKVVNNILEMDKCTKCNKSWLPDFPMSWLRSLTNLEKLHELVEDINKNEEYGVDNEDLLNLQKRHGGIKFNHERANDRGIEEYIKGSLKRRMDEYINQLRIMGIISKSIEKKYVLTEIGHQLMSNIENNKLIALYTLAYLNIKLDNGYQKINVKSCYKYFKIRFMENILKSIEFVNENHKRAASKYEIGLSVLCRDEFQLDNYCFKNIKSKSPQNIKDYMFTQETELNRSTVSSFLNIYISLNLIEKENKLYKLTPFGQEIIKFLEEYPCIWFDDIKIYTNEDITKTCDIAAKILLWRLLTNNILEVNDININISELEEAIKPFIKNTTFKDVHFNLFYDEPIEKFAKKKFTEKIIKSMGSYLTPCISYDIIESKCKELNHIWLPNLLNMVDNNIDKDFVNNFTQRAKLKSGEEWEHISSDYFKKLGIDIDFYKNNPVFSKLKIDTLNIYLPGGTLHNPDLLIKENIKGELKNILVDSKGKNSINKEIHKLKGYNIYASHPGVDSYAIIPLNGKLPKQSLNTLIKEKESFDRICVIERKALELLLTKNLSKEKVLEIILPLNGFKHITPNSIKSI